MRVAARMPIGAMLEVVLQHQSLRGRHGRLGFVQVGAPCQGQQLRHAIEHALFVGVRWDVRGVGFQSLTPRFWGACDGVADDWELHGFTSCAKGEPLQLMRVGHGAAHARFRDLPIEVRA